MGTWVDPLPFWRIGSTCRYYFPPTRVPLLKDKRSPEQAELPSLLGWETDDGRRSPPPAHPPLNSSLHLHGNQLRKESLLQGMGTHLCTLFSLATASTRALIRSRHLPNCTALGSSPPFSPVVHKEGYSRTRRQLVKLMQTPRYTHLSAFCWAIFASKCYLWPVLVWLGRGRLMLQAVAASRAMVNLEQVWT